MAGGNMLLNIMSKGRPPEAVKDYSQGGVKAFMTKFVMGIANCGAAL